MRKIDQYPIIGLGDVHTCLEFHQAIHQRDINLINRFNTKEWIDLARPELEYRGRYFEAAWPEFLKMVTAAERN